MWWILNVKIIKDTCDFNQNYKEGPWHFQIYTMMLSMNNCTGLDLF